MVLMKTHLYGGENSDFGDAVFFDAEFSQENVTRLRRRWDTGFIRRLGWS